MIISDFNQGMLASASTILAVADALKAHGQPITVIDPVRDILYVSVGLSIC
jgi:hydroxymethylpyrimidine/phosphomethylpyrimidine kinase